jgi:hypothetical protein
VSPNMSRIRSLRGLPPGCVIDASEALGNAGHVVCWCPDCHHGCGCSERRVCNDTSGRQRS